MCSLCEVASLVVVLSAILAFTPPRKSLAGHNNSEGAASPAQPTCPATRPNGRGLQAADGTQGGNHGDGARLATSLWDGAVVFKPGGPGCVAADGSLG